jgi:hypothetical protein
MNINQSWFTYYWTYNTDMKLLISAILFPILSLAESQKFYQDKYCQGIKKYALADRTGVSCVTDTHAIEYGFAKKWVESIGQSLGYAFETNKKAEIVLLVEYSSDYKYLTKLNSIIQHYKLPIDTWFINE